MAADIGLSHIAELGNKVDSPTDEAFIRPAMSGFELISIPP